MKVLVYGCGVIGSYLTHILCMAGNDVTVSARGKWKEILEADGLRIRHHLQRRETLDRPKVTEEIPADERYDCVFAVMPYDKMRAALDALAAARSPIAVLVGNNISPEAMRAAVLEKTVCPKQVLFGFQMTAGKRDIGRRMAVCERLGRSGMDIGGLRALPDEPTRRTLERLFAGTGYRLNWQPDMRAYLICHLALVLPISYLAYACGTDLRRASAEQRGQTRLATREAYAALRGKGIPILPEGGEKYFEPGACGMLMRLMYYALCWNRTIGDLVACEHCRNAAAEMAALDEAFQEIIADVPDALMPNWNALRRASFS